MTKYQATFISVYAGCYQPGIEGYSECMIIGYRDSQSLTRSSQITTVIVRINLFSFIIMKQEIRFSRKFKSYIKRFAAIDGRPP